MAKAAPTPKAAPAPKAAPVAKVEKAPRPPKIEQNGVTRPADGTATGNVWAIADKLSKQHKRPATRAEVFEHNAAQPEADQINEATVATQYQRWRVFNGVPKAEPVAKAVVEKAAPAAKAAPKSKKAVAAA